jgi:tetratricopeptide (TPR) repeat protein
MSLEINKLLKNKQYDEALQAVSTTVLDDIRQRRLHKDLVIQWRAPERAKQLMPKEVAYQDEAIQRFMDKNRGNESLIKALAHHKLGLVYENMAQGWLGISTARLEEATREYDKALSLFPDFACALFRKGAILSAQKKLEEALKNFVQAGEADPKFCEAFFFQGITYKILNNFDKALESYKKTVALDPDNAAAHNNMGLIHIYKKEYDLAEKEFEEVLRIFPNHPTGTKNLNAAKSMK